MNYRITPSCAKEITTATRRDGASYARIQDALLSLRTFGFEHMRDSGKIEKIRGKIHELRITLPHGIGRILFFVDETRTAQLVHFFVKKTRRTPQRNIDMAITRMHNN
jgi:phage-related protein